MNKIEEILEQVLMKHHDDISKQDDDAIAEATLAIKELVEKAVDEKEIEKTLKSIPYIITPKTDLNFLTRLQALAIKQHILGKAIGEL